MNHLFKGLLNGSYDAPQEISLPDGSDGSIEQLAVLVKIGALWRDVPALCHCADKVAAQCGTSNIHRRYSGSGSSQLLDNLS